MMNFVAFVLCLATAVLCAGLGHPIRCAFLLLLALANMMFILNGMDGGRPA